VIFLDHHLIRTGIADAGDGGIKICRQNSTASSIFRAVTGNILPPYQA
jgi:hypothetical protein